MFWIHDAERELDAFGRGEPAAGQRTQLGC
jgi:hypothetical protein